MDLLLGRFADHAIGDLSDSELSEFEILMTVPDQELYAWLCGRSEPPVDYDMPLLRMISDFHAARAVDR